MGSTDLCKWYLTCYHCLIKTKNELFTYFVMLLILNCWIYYAHYYKTNALKKYMSLMKNRMNVALELLKYEDSISDILCRGRPLYIPNSDRKEPPPTQGC